MSSSRTAASTSAFIDGVSIALRPVERADYLEHYARWLCDRTVTRHLFRGTWPASAESLARAHEQMTGRSDEFELCVVTKSDDRPVGITGLHAIHPVARSAELRILLGVPALWGRGIGTEATQLLVAYGFEMLNLNRVWLGVTATNGAALRSYEKCGFRREGVLRQEVWKNGAFADVIRLALLRPEYEAALPAWSTQAAIARQFRASS